MWISIPLCFGNSFCSNFKPIGWWTRLGTRLVNTTNYLESVHQVLAEANNVTLLSGTTIPQHGHISLGNHYDEMRVMWVSGVPLNSVSTNAMLYFCLNEPVLKTHYKCHIKITLRLILISGFYCPIRIRIRKLHLPSVRQYSHLSCLRHVWSTIQ